MCGRFNIIDDPLTQLLVTITGQGQGWSLPTEYNIAPTQQIPVLTRDEAGTWHQQSMRWWLVPAWSDGPSTKYSMFNARAESIAKSRAYRGPFQRQRCVVPASGYYEWKRVGEGKQPYYISPTEDDGFAFAGLWDHWAAGDENIYSCTIVTAAAPDSMKFLHHRIPVHLTAEQATAWVKAETATDELSALILPGIRTGIDVTPVSTYVNNARHKGEQCLEETGETITLPGT